MGGCQLQLEEEMGCCCNKFRGTFKSSHFHKYWEKINEVNAQSLQMHHVHAWFQFSQMSTNWFEQFAIFIVLVYLRKSHSSWWKNQKLFGKLWGRRERWAADVEPARSNVSLCERAQFPFLAFESLLADLKLRMETGRGASFQEGHQVQHKLHKCSLLKRHWWWKETWGISLHSPLYDIVAYIDNKNDKNGMYAHVCGLLAPQVL